MAMSQLQKRTIRFCVWALAMVVTSWVVALHYPRRVVLVPSFFVMIMVPAVLLPLEEKPKG